MALNMSVATQFEGLSAEGLEHFLVANFDPLRYAHPTQIGRALGVSLHEPDMLELVHNRRFSARLNHILLSRFNFDRNELVNLETDGDRLLVGPWRHVVVASNACGLLRVYRSFSQRVAKEHIQRITKMFGPEVVDVARGLRLRFEDQMESRSGFGDARLLAIADAYGREVLAAWLRSRPSALRRRFGLRMDARYLPAGSDNPRFVELFEAAAAAASVVDEAAATLNAMRSETPREEHVVN